MTILVPDVAESGKSLESFQTASCYVASVGEFSLAGAADGLGACASGGATNILEILQITCVICVLISVGLMTQAVIASGPAPKAPTSVVVLRVRARYRAPAHSAAPAIT